MDSEFGLVLKNAIYANVRVFYKCLFGFGEIRDGTLFRTTASWQTAHDQHPRTSLPIPNIVIKIIQYFINLSYFISWLHM